jgi:hypothetical protein
LEGLFLILYYFFKEKSRGFAKLGQKWGAELRKMGKNEGNLSENEEKIGKN